MLQQIKASAHIIGIARSVPLMRATYSGNYPIEQRAGEIERLRIQSKALAPDTLVMLDQFGPMQGWACVDIGCGPGGITELLSALVGPNGQVIGLDMDAEFLENARGNAPSNVEFRLGDAYGSDLPAGAFDLRAHALCGKHRRKS